LSRWGAGPQPPGSIKALEARGTDPSGLVPHSERWLEYWNRQVLNYIADREHVPLTLEAVRAVMRYANDSAPLVGSIAGIVE
jgi:hypothetical protein